MHPSSAITSLKLQVELLSLPRRCGQHGVSTNGDGECHLDAFHPLPMHNLGRFGNQSTVEEPYNGGKTHAISDTEFGGVGLGVYRGFVSLTVAPKLDSPKISSVESVESSSRMPGSQVRLWRFPCNKPHFLWSVSPYFSQSKHPFFGTRNLHTFRGWDAHLWSTTSAGRLSFQSPSIFVAPQKTYVWAHCCCKACLPWKLQMEALRPKLSGPFMHRLQGTSLHFCLLQISIKDNLSSPCSDIKGCALL